MGDSQIVVGQGGEQVVSRVVSGSGRTPKLGDPGAVWVVARVEQLLFETQFRARSGPSVSTEGSDVVHKYHSDADEVSMDPQGVEPGFCDQWSVEDKAQADEKTGDFLEDHDLIDPPTRLGPFVEDVHDHG